MAELRPYRPEDRDALYDICLKTGAAGWDATQLYRDPELVGHVYAGPYVALSPETIFVVEDEFGVGGYIVGPADTRSFETACEAEWWPALRARYPEYDPGDDSLDARMIRHIHHPPRTPDPIAESHPAHLHINLLSRLQGQGWGRKLIGTWRAKMAKLGASACHLAVGLGNPEAIAFYRAYGFDEIARVGTRQNVIIFGMPTK